MPDPKLPPADPDPEPGRPIPPGPEPDSPGPDVIDPDAPIEPMEA